MPIPAFDSNSVIPPHVGDPANPAELSPYPCTLVELCERFGTTAPRKRILEGLLEFREVLVGAGFSGFQWLDGSFLENIEGRENRPPNDLDVVTYFFPPDSTAYQAAIAKFPILVDQPGIRKAHFLDHYFVNLTYNPIALVENVRYWSGLFSHRRDGVWKGMLRVELATLTDDQAAVELLRRHA